MYKLQTKQVEMQLLFQYFLQKYRHKLLLIQPEIYIVDSSVINEIQIQITWKSTSHGGYLTYYGSTDPQSDYATAI